MSNKKVETIAEFLARGGVISKHPPQAKGNNPVTRRTTATSATSMLTMEEAEILYTKSKAKKEKKASTKQSKIDISALPEHLRVKFMARVKEALGGEET